MDSNTVKVDDEERVRYITLNRPEKLNAQNPEMLRALDDAVQDAGRDHSVHVLVIQGAGTSFSSGHDLEHADWDPDAYDPERRLSMEQDLFVDISLRLRNCPKPTIAKVRGYCLAAGMMVASMCDLIVASRDAEFGNPVIQMAFAGVELLVEPWDLGARKAKEWLFTGDRFPADEAYRLGLVNRLEDEHELDRACESLARKIASRPPFALKVVKRSVNATLDNMGQAASFENHFGFHVAAHSSTENRRFREALAARGGGFRPGGLDELRKLMQEDASALTGTAHGTGTEGTPA